MEGRPDSPELRVDREHSGRPALALRGRRQSRARTPREDPVAAGVGAGEREREKAPGRRRGLGERLCCLGATGVGVVSWRPPRGSGEPRLRVAG